MRVLVTGSQGFIGKNLIVHLEQDDQISVLTFSRDNTIDELALLVEQADAIVHLAGENRPKEVSAFEEVNARYTQQEENYPLYWHLLYKRVWVIRMDRVRLLQKK